MAKTANFITLEGRNMVRDALMSGQRVNSLVIGSGSAHDPKVREIEKLARNRGISVQVIRSEELEKMSESKNAQGIMATMEAPEVKSFEQILRDKREILVLLLNHIDYEQNLGAIMRTAWAAGVDVVVASPNGVHQVTPVVAKISMGAVAYVPLIPMSLFQAMKLLHKYAVPVVGVEVDMGKSIYDSKLTGPMAILMGGEAEGLSEPLQKECDSFVNIPMKKEVASLNVSVATALVLFEKVRQAKA
jgi:23S rRNA (guanosine2251-2'-O)-methyltransferase